MISAIGSRSMGRMAAANSVGSIRCRFTTLVSKNNNVLTTKKNAPQQSQGSKNLSTTTSGFFEADAGAMGTHIHHRLSQALAVLTPLYLLAPTSDGGLAKAFGVLLSINISAHSWIGLNYVARDYVPKISAKLAGPARVGVFAMSAITLIGMSKIALFSPGGIKGVLFGVWSKPSPATSDEESKQ